MKFREWRTGNEFWRSFGFDGNQKILARRKFDVSIVDTEEFQKFGRGWKKRLLKRGGGFGLGMTKSMDGGGKLI